MEDIERMLEDNHREARIRAVWGDRPVNHYERPYKERERYGLRDAYYDIPASMPLEDEEGHSDFNLVPFLRGISTYVLMVGTAMMVVGHPLAGLIICAAGIAGIFLPLHEE